MPEQIDLKLERLLSQIIRLTEQQEFDGLAIKLMEGLGSWLPDTQIEAVSVSRDGRIAGQFVCPDGINPRSHDEINLEPEIERRLIDTHQQGFKTREQELGSSVLATLLLYDDGLLAHYLIMVLPERLPENLHIIRALLTIFRNLHALVDYAHTDQLTGLSNRKTFETTINRVYELQRLAIKPNDIPCRRSSHEKEDRYWICLIDIDHFKQVNDDFGHLYGDEVLVRLAQIMRAEFRLEDRLFRFGGEEFIALLNAPDRADALTAMERFRQSVQDNHFAGVGHISVSLGAVEVDPSMFHMTLMDYADQALYYSKRNGRNRITFFEDILASGEAHLEQFTEGSVNFF